MKQGFTLLELLITLTIFMILIGIAIPSYRIISERNQANAEIIQLYRTIQLARSEAIKHNEIMCLCGSSNQKSCDGDWSAGYILFVDKDANGVVGASEMIVQSIHRIAKGGQLSWKGFPNRNYLQFLPLGITNNQNGTFTYLLNKGAPQFKKSLIISKLGRVRFS